MSRSGRFLIVSWDGGGNAPPAINLGARLVRRGHQVRLLGWESMAARADAAGLEFATYPSVPPWPPELAFEDAMEDRFLPALLGPGTRDDVLFAARSFAPDVLVVDCMMGAGLEAASLLGLPRAVLVHLPYCAFMHEWGDEATPRGEGPIPRRGGRGARARAAGLRHARPAAGQHVLRRPDH